jgi:hypothetical protein
MRKTTSSGNILIDTDYMPKLALHVIYKVNNNRSKGFNAEYDRYFDLTETKLSTNYLGLHIIDEHYRRTHEFYRDDELVILEPACCNCGYVEISIEDTEQNVVYYRHTKFYQYSSDPFFEDMHNVMSKVGRYKNQLKESENPVFSNPCLQNLLVLLSLGHK